MDVTSLVNDCPDIIIVDAFFKAHEKIRRPRYRVIVCSVSGGSDSDVVLDICHKFDEDKRVKYVWFDTGLEYKATKEHLDFLEQKYDIKIDREKAVKPIPLTCRQYGVPFLSKYVSEMIYRLQKNNFKWENRPYEELIKEYPNCQSALKWWCNKNLRRDGKIGTLNIARDKWLKEFIIENPPSFKISNKCCYYAKKAVASKYNAKVDADLSIMGIRKAEGGIRSVKYKSCFSYGKDYDEYFPAFWFSNSVKSKYDEFYGITHSRCYSEYGLTRTGCAGCPFNNNFESELQIIQKYEPLLFKAVIKIFGEAYDYTRRFREYARLREMTKEVIS